MTSGAVYANAGVPLKRAGRWLAPQRSTLTVPPRSQRTASFTVDVPAGTPPGDHLAGIALQAMHPQRSKGRFSVTEIFRVVVGVEVIVPGPAKAAARLTHLSLAALPGTHIASVVADIGNAGGLLCKPTLSVTLRGAGRARTVVRHLDTVLGGDTIPFPLPWPVTLKSGLYRVSATATGCGPTARLAALARNGAALRGTAASAPVPVHTIIKKTGSGGLVPIALAALALGLLGGALLGRRRGAKVALHQSAPADEDDSVAEVTAAAS